MDLASGYSDSSANPFGYVNNAVANNQNNMLANYNANLAYVAAQNQAALAAAGPTPYGYGFVGGTPTFGDPAAPGTYSPGSGLSSFSGTSLGGGYNALDQMAFGGPADTAWMQAGSNGPRPSSLGGGFGGSADTAWMQAGSNGLRPSSFASSTGPQQVPEGPFDSAAAPYNSYGQPGVNNAAGTYGDPYGGSFGGAADTSWMQSGSYGARPSTLGGGFGGAADTAWMQAGSHGDRPSSFADRFGGGTGQTEVQSQNQPAIDAVNNAGRGTPQLSDFASQNPFLNYQSGGDSGQFGGPADVAWMQAGSNGPRPSTLGGGFGGPADVAWMQAGSNGPRPSSLMVMNSGSDPSWLGAGGTQNSYNPFGQINSGQVGQYDAFGGPADVAWMQGGSVGPRPSTANPNFQQGGGFGMGSAFDPATYGGSTGNPAFSFDQRYPAGVAGGSPGFGNYPQQPMASDNMANQQQMISDLYKTLGIIDNAGESSGYNPSGNTLRQSDYTPRYQQSYSGM